MSFVNDVLALVCWLVGCVRKAEGGGYGTSVGRPTTLSGKGGTGGTGGTGGKGRIDVSGGDTTFTEPARLGGLLPPPELGAGDGGATPNVTLRLPRPFDPLALLLPSRSLDLERERERFETLRELERELALDFCVERRESWLDPGTGVPLRESAPSPKSKRKGEIGRRPSVS